MGLAEQILWWGNVSLILALGIKLAVAGLHRTYRWFFAFLTFQVVQSAVMLPLDPARDEYAWAYLLTQPVLWVLYILVVLEVYSLALRNHPGIASLSRWVLLGGLIISISVSALTLSADLSNPTGRFPVLVYVGVIERGLTFSLVVFLLLISGFLLWTPIRLPRNVALHACVYSLYFFSTASGLLIRNVLGYQLVGGVSVAILSSYDLCLLLWILFLNRKGEETPVTLRKLWRQADEDQITRQLDAINAFLLRSAGKQDR